MSGRLIVPDDSQFVRTADALKARTPCCGRSVDLPFYQHAATVVKRTCRRCKGVWTVVVTPVARASWGWAHKLEWTPREPEGPITL